MEKVSAGLINYSPYGLYICINIRRKGFSMLQLAVPRKCARVGGFQLLVASRVALLSSSSPSASLRWSRTHAVSWDWLALNDTRLHETKT